MNKLLASFTLVFICAGAVWAEDRAMPRFDIPTARSSGMGGAHAAYTDNVFALIVNPAALMRTQQVSVFALTPMMLNPEATFGLIPPLMNVMGGDGLSSLGEAANILSKQQGKVSLGYDMREFPLSVAWAANGFGFGLWNRIFVNANIIGTHIEIHSYADLFLPVGFAFKILDTSAHTVDAGITVKPFVRGLISQKLNIMDMIDSSSDILDDFSIPIIAGAGFDLGFMYRWDAGLRAGLTFADIVTRGGVVTSFMGRDTNSYYVPFSMNLGLAYDFKIGTFWTGAPSLLANTGITFAFDWRDITNAFQQDDYTRRNAALDIGVGLQICVLDMFSVRMGMNEMLPAFGIGVDLGAFEFDAAYYGKELGKEPGQLSAAALEFTIAVRPDAKKRDWPWTRGSLVGLISGSEKAEPAPAAQPESAPAAGRLAPAQEAAADAEARMDESLDQEGE